MDNMRRERGIQRQEKLSPTYHDLTWFLTSDPLIQDAIKGIERVPQLYEKLSDAEKKKFTDFLDEREMFLKTLKASGNATGDDFHRMKVKLEIVERMKKLLGCADE